MSKKLIIFCIFLIAIIAPSPILAEDYKVVISKSNKELILKKSNNIIKKYQIATGKGGKGTKRKRGDSKTPLGVYRIFKLKKSKRFHYFIQLDCTRCQKIRQMIVLTLHMSYRSLETAGD